MFKFSFHTEEKTIQASKHRKFTITLKLFNIKIFTFSHSTIESFL